MGTFSYLGKENENLIKMYTTARQFRNAIKPSEILQFKKDGFENKVFPYVVNRSFSCEIYLKLIIKNNGDSFENVHNIKQLLVKAKIGEEFEKYILKGVALANVDYSIERLDQDIETISKAFVNWRYIYEQDDITVAAGLLDLMNDYLDSYCKRIIKARFDVDMDQYPFI